MINNKKGLSAIVTTLLVILLVLVAVGIVWGVVNRVIQGGAEDLELSAKCLNVDVQATAVVCTGAACDVTLERTGSNNDEIAGVKLVFRDSVNSENSPAAIDVEGNVAKLVGFTTTDTSSGVTAPDSVEVTAYFEDASGNEQLCGQTTTYTF